MTHPVKSPKKLIEVALPLDAINEAAAREKSIRHGHPSTLHLWWARRPLAAARAVIFSQLVNDPSWKWELENPGKIPPAHLKASWAASRKRLFKIIEDLVQWENTTNETVLEKARAEIRRSWREVCELNQDHPQAAELFNPDKLPALHDPFAGGGSIPLEAQRLGLEAYASDLNPVAVLINKAMIEIPPKFANQPPVNPESRKPENMLGKEWKGAAGLAEDVRYYGARMREEAQKRIGHFYPPVEITAEMAADRPDLKSLIGQKLTVIAWLWARTVKSPNPAFSHVDVPLSSSFVLSSKPGNEVYVNPTVNGSQYSFGVQIGAPTADARAGTKAKGHGADFRCLISDVPISGDYIKNEGQAGRIGSKLVAIVAEGSHGRVYLSPTKDAESIAKDAYPLWKPDVEFYQHALGFRIGNYGMTKWSDLFTSRQLLALTTFVDICEQVRQQLNNDPQFVHNSTNSEPRGPISNDGITYADAVAVFLALGISRSSSMWSSNCWWQPNGGFIAQVFTRQAIPIIWDFAEGNPFSEATGNWSSAIEWITRALCLLPGYPQGNAFQHDAASKVEFVRYPIVSTDPPYFDNVGYADLSDFYYVWLRRLLRPVFPLHFSTLTIPKEAELVATPGRHGGRRGAEQYFLAGMTTVMSRLVEQVHPVFPISIYYAFKQSETESTMGTTSSGWETFLESVIRAGFTTTGTWPIRTEREGGVRNNERNSLASSIILICCRRPVDAPTISRRQFLRELNAVLPEALDEMTKGAGDDRSPVAPVDLSQAIIGPGMAVFSKYAAVLEADGTPMSVRTALQLINRFLAEDDFDADTQFCLHWFDQYGWSEGAYGEADVLARAKATSVGGLVESGVLRSGGGKVRLLRPDEYALDWNPAQDSRLPVWEALHQLIRVLRQQGESGAGQLLNAVKAKGEGVRQLAYRLYTLCERQGWAEDARAYNELITSWSGIESVASEVTVQPLQPRLIE